MEHSIFGFVWRHSQRQQIVVTLLTLVSFPFLYLSLDLPKRIVNEAIAGEGGFPKTIAGVPFDQIPFLFILSGLFLVLVIVNGGFKYYINVYKGRLGERMLRRLRYDLFARVLRFRLPRFKRMSQGEIIAMITGEVEPLGGFIGDALAQPIFQGGTLLVYLVFIFIQDPVLGAAAVALYPFQGWIIPRLQRTVNQLGKQRVRTVRQLSERIGETVSGTQEIHAHGTARFHLADFSSRLGQIYDIRYEIYRRKFFIKFLNNFINQLTPFFFYAIGGYLVIEGSLSFGALVAVLAAYKDLAAPWKELLDYYQQMQDNKIKYEQVVEQFQPEDIIPAEQITGDAALDGPFPAAMALSNVVYSEFGGRPAVDGVTMSLDLCRHTAVLGDAASGRDELMMLLGRLLVPTAGRIRLGDADYDALSEDVIGRHIAYVGPGTFMFTDTLRANLYYGLKHRPTRDAEYGGGAAGIQRRRVVEALASGNTELDINADWVDYQAVGADGPEALQAKALDALALADMDGDVYRMGLGGTIDPDVQRPMADKVLEARGLVRESLAADAELGQLVELWDADRFNGNATVAENLLFGTPVGAGFAPDSLADNPYVLQVLEKAGLTRTFLEVGTAVAETMIELFADLPPGHEFFEQFSFIGSEELPDYQVLVNHARKEGLDALRPEERTRLMSLPFKLIPSRHRLDLIDEGLRDRLVEARRLFAADLPEELRASIEFFDAERYNGAATIQDNILFGKMRYGRANQASRVQDLIATVIDQLGLRHDVMAVGLDHSVGVGGSRLAAAQRQKLALARAVLKEPDLLILNQATSALDAPSQVAVHQRLRERFDGKGILWAPHRPSLAREFDDVVVMHEGKVVERGGFDAVNGDTSVVRQLMHAE